jgi:hypothetical protein
MPPNCASIHYLDDEGKIADIGVSSAHDLFTDNLGALLASLISNGGVIRTFTDTSGATFSGQLKYGGSTSMFNNPANAASFQLGLGTTVVARDDPAIETPCASAPESSAVTLTNQAGYASGVVSLVTNIGPFGATEAITEGALYISVEDTSSVAKSITLLRYNFAETTVPISKTAVISVSISN